MSKAKEQRIAAGALAESAVQFSKSCKDHLLAVQVLSAAYAATLTFPDLSGTTGYLGFLVSERLSGRYAT